MDDFPSIPRATYRLQFHHGFNFKDARTIIPYLHRLGISHIYASPIFRASPGSIHGYDICDHNELNPELGTREDFDALADTALRHDMRLVLDFVPNHMGIAESSNPWWMSVLEDGPSSPHAHCFDIDWSPLKMEMKGQVLLAILDDQYGRVLESGGIQVRFHEGAFFIECSARRLPAAPHSVIPLLKHAAEGYASGAPDELESIIYALENLPGNHETDPERIRQKAREKNRLKERLATLCREQPEVENQIQKAVDALNQTGDAGCIERLDRFVSSQSYRLAYWRVAADEINYRRFFDVNDLAALRMNLPEVYDVTHRLVLDLLSTPAVSGLRIDHIDGLCDPQAYLERLQEDYAARHKVSADKRPLYLLVEKILGRDEHLRTSWPVHGTTGYEFAAQITNVLVDAKAAKAMTRIYEKFSGLRTGFSDCVYRGKLLVMRTSMASEVTMLAHMLHHLSQTNRWYRDFTLNALEKALREVIACFAVYRSYISPEAHGTSEDHRLILRAIAMARRRNADLERTVFEFLRDVLLPPAENAHPVEEKARREFVLRFQQSTGPITAKGVEDTAFYVYNRLVALNEVGGEPGCFGADVADFHKRNLERLASHPHSMLATSTHDTKRSEDVRARIAVLSELPKEWDRLLRLWHRANRALRPEVDGIPAPDANEEYLLYQTLVGSWPLHEMNEEERADYVSRIQHYMTKAMHEAKVNSSWLEPNKEWDQAVGEFVSRILTPDTGRKFLETFTPFVKRVSAVGMTNSLVQVAAKLTSPGVPDLYQGQECWDFSLVDPDNRRPVHYDQRQQFQENSNATPAELLEGWKDGRIKFFMTATLLQLRRQHPALFAEGSYEPIEFGGSLASHCFGFRRVLDHKRLEVIMPRLTATLGSPPVKDCWLDSWALLEPSDNRHNLITGSTLNTRDQKVPLAQVFEAFPVAALWSEHS